MAISYTLSLYLLTYPPLSSSSPSGLVGLAISYALSVTNLLSGVVTSFTETEKEMVSVERAMQYIKETPKEKREGDTIVSAYSKGGINRSVSQV